MENIENNINIENTQQEIQVDSNELNNALRHFNWGAFGFTWLWGLGNGSFKHTWIIIIPYLLMCIPIINILAALAYLGISIYFGTKGNEWAYEGRAWWSLTDFTETQKRWATAVAVIAILMVVLILVYILFIAAMIGSMAGGYGR